MARTEVRKECPSCGLGVPLDAKVCEFCGWDFEEEDEWISQIEQLERELMSEKQKTESAKVDRMIKSTLRSPVREKPDQKPPAVSKPIAVTVKKRIPTKPEGVEVATETAEVTSVPIAKPEEKAIFVQAKAPEEELPPPPEELEEKKPVPSKPVGVVTSGQAPSIPGKKVRRVVKTGKKPESPPQKPAPSATKPGGAAKPVVPEKPVTAAPAISAGGSPRQASPKSSQPAMPAEKKGLFAGLGKIFSMKVPTGQKPVSASAPSAKPATTGKTVPAVTPAKKEQQVVTVKVFVCPLCNAEVKETEKICPKCGAEFE